MPVTGECWGSKSFESLFTELFCSFYPWFYPMNLLLYKEIKRPKQKIILFFVVWFEAIWFEGWNSNGSQNLVKGAILSRLEPLGSVINLHERGLQWGSEIRPLKIGTCEFRVFWRSDFTWIKFSKTWAMLPDLVIWSHLGYFFVNSWWPNLSFGNCILGYFLKCT